MSNQRIFDDIMNQFNSDDEEEEEENEESKHSEKEKKHKKSSSIADTSNNLIKDKLFNTDEESTKKTKTQNRKKDEFGYFVNDDNDENVEENNDDNENNEKSDSNENKESSAKDNNENNDNNEILSDKKEDNDLLIKSIHEEQEENDQDNNENENNENNLEDNQENNNEEEQENNGEENQENEVQQNEDNNNENSEKNNDEEIKENENTKSEEQNINEENNKDEINEENDLINELYEKNKTENIDHSEIELFRMGSFRPNPVPSSPKFSERISKSNEPIIEKEGKEDKEANNNLTNFTETIETTIEGDKAQTKESINKYIPKYTHNNTIISLGKIPSKELISSNNINNVELLDMKNKKINEDSQNKSTEYEEKAEEEFLKREELKMQKSKEENKDNQDNKKKQEKKQENKEIVEMKDIKNENNKKEDEDGKENVTEDEEDKKNNNNNFKKENESIIQNEIKEDSKEYIFSSVNTINNENNSHNERKSNNNNEINQIKVNVMSIKVLEQIQNSGNSQNSSAIHSHKNSDAKKIENNNEKNNNENKTNKNMGVNRNIYSKKIAQERNTNKNNKKIINQMPVMKNVLYESPSDKKMRKNNNNYSNDQSQKSSKNKDITPFDYINSNISKQMSSKKKNRIINANTNKKINNQNNDINEKNNKNNNAEKFPFKPQLDKKSLEMSEKKLNNIKNNNTNNNQNPQNQTTSLGLLLLYEDAETKQKKLNQERVEQNNEIINKANSKKINNVSYNMVNDRSIKRIDNAIRKFGKKHQSNLVLNIVGMAQCLYELNIINELIKPKDNIQDLNVNNHLDLVELQAMVESVNKKDIKKSEEIVLIEQLWFLLNPELKPNIDSNILCIFLKLFFCGNYSQKDLEKLIISLLEKYKINNIEKKEDYKSPLRDKIYNQNDIWPLAKFIKVFLNLKKDLKAYRENDYTKGDVYNNIIKEKDKDLTFEPNNVSNKYFYKYSQFQYNKDNSIIALINKYKNQNQKQKHDFNKVYERFKADKELHEKTLQKIREKQEENELKMCTNVPKINKYVPKTRNPSTEKKNNTSDLDIKQPRYKLLYNLRKKFNKNDRNEIRIDRNDIVDENCTFKPQISDDKELLNRTFSNLKIKKKPKGFNDYVNRNRSVLKNKELEKKLEDDKKYGRNYDKMKKMKTKIKPLNITDLNKSPSKEKINMQYINNTETKGKKRYQLENEKIENIIQNIYVTLDIKTPIGTVNQLKIYNKPDKQTVEDVCNFCKIFSLNDEMKKMLIKKAIIFKNNFFGKNNDIIKEDGFLTHEEFESVSNTYKKK